MNWCLGFSKFIWIIGDTFCTQLYKGFPWFTTWFWPIRFYFTTVSNCDSCQSGLTLQLFPMETTETSDLIGQNKVINQWKCFIQLGAALENPHCIYQTVQTKIRGALWSGSKLFEILRFFSSYSYISKYKKTNSKIVMVQSAISKWSIILFRGERVQTMIHCKTTASVSNVVLQEKHIIGPDETLCLIRGVSSRHLIFVDHGHLYKTFLSFHLKC